MVFSRHASALGLQPRRAAGFRQFAHAQDVALALGDRDHAARVEQVEDVAGLDALVVGRQRHQVALSLASGFGSPASRYLRQAASASRKCAEQHLGVGILEIVAGIFLLGLQEDVAVGDLLGRPRGR